MRLAIAVLLAVVLAAGGAAAEKGMVAKTTFALYLLQDQALTTRDVENKRVELSELKLAVKPLLTMRDVDYYDWNSHRLGLKPKVASRIPKPGVWGVPFVLVVEGKRIYMGSFYSLISSWLPSCPYASLWSENGRDELRIDRVVTDKEPTPPDPRCSPEIKKVFERAGKLRTKTEE